MRPLQEAILAALSLSSMLVSRGHEAAVVGGAVRDLLLSRRATEADLATSAPMEEILDIWPGSPVLGRPPAVTVIVLSRGCRIDVSTFQGKDLEEDLGRRDLTINAMAMVPDGTIIDPWGEERSCREAAQVHRRPCRETDRRSSESGKDRQVCLGTPRVQGRSGVPENLPRVRKPGGCHAPSPDRQRGSPRP